MYLTRRHIDLRENSPSLPRLGTLRAKLSHFGTDQVAWNTLDLTLPLVKLERHRVMDRDHNGGVRDREINIAYIV